MSWKRTARFAWRYLIAPRCQESSSTARSDLDRPQAGIIFYNVEASEIGGLIFGGRRDSHGDVVDSGGSLSFDRYEANQIVQLIGVDDKEDKMAGLAVLDSPSGTETQRRIWLGRGEDGAATLALLDGQGKKRLVFQVAANGSTTVTSLDADGKVVKDLLAAETRSSESHRKKGKKEALLRISLSFAHLRHSHMLYRFQLKRGIGGTERAGARLCHCLTMRCSQPLTGLRSSFP